MGRARPRSRELHGPDDDGHPLGHDLQHGSEHPRELHAQRHGAELPNGDEPTNRRQRHRDRYRHLRRLSGVAERRAEQLHGEWSEPPHGDGARQWDGPDHVLGELHGPDDDGHPLGHDRHHGQNIPASYTLNVTGPSFPTGTSQPIGANATVTATVTSGDYQVSLSDVPSNCTVSGANPRTVTVPANGTGRTTFAVSCTAPTTTGTRSVTTSTTGQNIPASYTLNVTGPSFPTGTSQPIGANATVTATVTSGDYQVSLSGVPSNCTVSGANPRTVTVPANGTGPTTFSVSCTAPTTTGTLSVTTATTVRTSPRATRSTSRGRASQRG